MITGIEYKGFTNSPTFLIYKDGKQVFTAKWQDCHTLEQAMVMIDQSLAQQERPASVQVPDTECEEIENSTEEAERFTDWMRQGAEDQMWQEEKY